MYYHTLVAQLVMNPPAIEGFDPWVRKIPWRKEWLSTPVRYMAETNTIL